jgi:hypothetical protein
MSRGETKRHASLLPLGAALATLAVVALLAWCVAEDARQAALLDARVREAEGRVRQALDQEERLRQVVKQGIILDGAQAEEVRQAELEYQRAGTELVLLRTEQRQRQRTWRARLCQEVRLLTVRLSRPPPDG